MATGRSTKLTGAVGEFLVAAELCRRDLIATPFSGNVPHYDIVASDQFGGHLVIQVKTINYSSWQLNVSNFIKVTMNGNRQELGDLLDDPYSRLYCVFVALGDTFVNDRYFIFSWKELQSVVVKLHRSFLEKHNGIRPRAPKSTHCAINISNLVQYENKWRNILEALVRTRTV